MRASALLAMLVLGTIGRLLRSAECIDGLRTIYVIAYAIYLSIVALLFRVLFEQKSASSFAWVRGKYIIWHLIHLDLGRTLDSDAIVLKHTRHND